MENHYGIITIDWHHKSGTQILLECIDINGNQRFEYKVSLSELQFITK
jgi:hypothetical protein